MSTTKKNADAPTVKYFKVLGADSRSKHGGDMLYSLPKGRKKGDWHEVEGELSACFRGLHLTSKPALWWLKDAKVYEAEFEGESVVASDTPDKLCCRKVRLIREVAWEQFQVWTTGEHRVDEGHAVASGSATVEASGSATVRASGSATVRASGSATVRASGSATVRASGSATVRAFGSATVRASGSATVRASGSATVRASGSATVIQTVWHNNKFTVALDGQAVCVDRRGGQVKVSVAPVAGSPA